MSKILEVKNLSKIYPLKKMFKTVDAVHAVKDANFSVEEKKTLAIVGESGCGKSTLAKLLMGIETPTSGDIFFHGKNLNEISSKERVKLIQMIFQDPYGSLNPRKKVWELISEPLKIQENTSKDECREKVRELMSLVGLRPEMMDRYPHMFSGGQRQRIGIARALVLKPKILICDEPVSALDVSVQAQVMNLLVDLQKELGLTYLFISHDLSVVRHLSDEVMVIYFGEIVERGKVDQVFDRPEHEYTKKLLSSTPRI